MRDRSPGHHSIRELPARQSLRDRSRESHRSHRSRDPAITALREISREEKEAERDKRDREMADERREAARLRDEHFAEVNQNMTGLELTDSRWTASESVNVACGNDLCRPRLAAVPPRPTMHLPLPESLPLRVIL